MVGLFVELTTAAKDIDVKSKGTDIVIIKRSKMYIRKTYPPDLQYLWRV